MKRRVTFFLQGTHVVSGIVVPDDATWAVARDAIEKGGELWLTHGDHNAGFTAIRIIDIVSYKVEIVE